MKKKIFWTLLALVAVVVIVLAVVLHKNSGGANASSGGNGTAVESSVDDELPLTSDDVKVESGSESITPFVTDSDAEDQSEYELPIVP